MKEGLDDFMETFVVNYGKFVINGFEITCPLTLDTIGWGIYLEISVVDHSCDPNAIVAFHGNTLTLVYTGQRYYMQSGLTNGKSTPSLMCVIIFVLQSCM